jgi:hypothetical protein
VVCGGYRGLAVIQYDGRCHMSKSPPKASPKLREKEKLERMEQTDAVMKAERPKEPQSLFQTEPIMILESLVCMPVDDIYVSYTLTHLLRGQENMEPILKGLDRTLSDKCFLALATTYYGATHHEKVVSESGLQRYSGALKELNQALRVGKRVGSYDLLESVIIMTLFEVSSLLSLSILLNAIRVLRNRRTVSDIRQ